MLGATTADEDCNSRFSRSPRQQQQINNFVCASLSRCGVGAYLAMHDFPSIPTLAKASLPEEKPRFTNHSRNIVRTDTDTVANFPPIHRSLSSSHITVGLLGDCNHASVVEATCDAPSLNSFATVLAPYTIVYCLWRRFARNEAFLKRVPGEPHGV